MKIRLSGDVLLVLAGFGSALFLPPLIEVASDVQERAAISMAFLLLQGLYFWNSKREQRRLLKQARALLNHKIRNSLQVLVSQLPLDYANRDLVWDAVGRITDALNHVEADRIKNEYYEIFESRGALNSAVSARQVDRKG